MKIRKLSSVADYVLICSGDSTKQVQAIASNVEDGLRAKKVRPLCVEGYETGQWILLDYADVVVHVFLEPVRTLYDLEGLWVDAERTDVNHDAKHVLRKEKAG